MAGKTIEEATRELKIWFLQRFGYLGLILIGAYIDYLSPTPLPTLPGNETIPLLLGLLCADAMVAFGLVGLIFW